MRLTAATLVAFSLAAFPGCRSYFYPEPTHVAQGRYYAAGAPDYDEFFLELYRTQVALKEAPDELLAGRRALEEGLGLTAGASKDALESGLRARASSLAAKGIVLSIQRDSTGKSSLSRRGKPSADDDVKLVATLTDLVATIGALRERVPGFAKDLDTLPVRGVALERNVNDVFRTKGVGKRGEVRDNLADAQKVMGLMRPLLKDVDARSAELFSILTDVLRPAPPPPPAPEPEAAEPPQLRPHAPRARPRSPKPAAARPASPPPAAPSPKPAGPAKPDFEP